MTIEHDPYSDLPALPLWARLEFQDMEPAHFLRTPEMLAESGAVGSAVHALVTRYVQHLGDEAVQRTTHDALIAVRHVIDQAIMAGGDVTPSE